MLLTIQDVEISYPVETDLGLLRCVYMYHTA